MTGPGFWRDQTVLITGGLGFIGSKIAHVIVSGGGLVIIADRDVAALPDPAPTESRQGVVLRGGDIGSSSWIGGLVEEYQPSYVFHLAGQSIIEECTLNPVGGFESNITGTWNLLEACRRNGSTKGVVVASSYKVYGQQDDACFSEESPLLGLQPYDAAKVCADVLARSYHESFGLPVAVTRCANTYGEGDRHLSRIIPAVIHAALHDDELIIRSDGRVERDYLYVGDVVAGYLSIADGFVTGDVKGHAFNLGSGTPASVLDIVHTIERLLDTKVRYRILQEKQPTVDRMYLDIRKAKARLNWEPRSTLVDGLTRTIEWHRNALGQGNAVNPRIPA